MDPSGYSRSSDAVALTFFRHGIIKIPIDISTHGR